MGKKKNDNVTHGALLPFGGAYPPGFSKDEEELFEEDVDESDFSKLFEDDNE